MHAYFPALNCFPSLLGDMLADAINCLGFTWVREYKHEQHTQPRGYKTFSHSKMSHAFGKHITKSHIVA